MSGPADAPVPQTSATDAPEGRATPRAHRFFEDASRYVDRFGLLLMVTVASIVALSLIDIVGPSAPTDKEVASLLASVMVAVTLLLALRASGLARRWQRWADVAVLVGVTALTLVVLLRRFGGVTPVYDVGNSPPLFVVAIAILAPLVVVRRLLQHREVHSGTLLGAVSAYLLIPVAYYYLFLFVNSFEGSDFFGAREPTTAFMYFSLATVTTVGYGDLAPASNIARLLSTSEALVGQVYLVTFVAMLVGLAASRWRANH
jgi:hypothetical protein